MRVDFEGVTEDTVYVRYAPVSNWDSVSWDTLVMRDGFFVWNKQLEKMTEVGFELGRDRKQSLENGGEIPFGYRVAFLVSPGEKVRMRARYENDFLCFELEGSPQLSAQSAMRTASRDLYVRMQELHEEIGKALENGVKNADEALVDSLSELYSQARKEMADRWLDFVRNFPDDIRSGCYLLEYPVKDTFLLYYDRLGNVVKESVLKVQLQEMREKAVRLRALASNAEKLKPGTEAPDFEMTDVNGRKFRLSDYADRYVVLDFWGTWCPWCVKGIPRMKEYYGKYRSRVEFIGVASRDELPKLKDFLRKEKIVWTNARNAEGGNPDVVLLYGVSGYPTKILLGPGLKVEGRYLGEVPDFYRKLDSIR